MLLLPMSGLRPVYDERIDLQVVMCDLAHAQMNS